MRLVSAEQDMELRWRALTSSCQMVRVWLWKMPVSMSSRMLPPTRWASTPADLNLTTQTSQQEQQSKQQEEASACTACRVSLSGTIPEGGVNSSSLEVFAALALPPEDHSTLMCYDPRKGCLVA